MAKQNFYDMTDTAENIDSVIHDLVEVVTEENDGKVLMVEKVADEETDEVSINDNSRLWMSEDVVVEVQKLFLTVL